MQQERESLDCLTSNLTPEEITRRSKVITSRLKQFETVKTTLLEQLDRIWKEPIHVEQRKSCIVVDKDWKNNKLDCKNEKGDFFLFSFF